MSEPIILSIKQVGSAVIAADPSLVPEPGLSAYEIAVREGFSGTQAEWLVSIEGASAYALAVEEGYSGTQEEWVLSLQGKSAYDIAVENGYTGSESEWLLSLVGKSAYEIAVELGYSGTEQQWIDSLEGQSAYELAVSLGYVGTEQQWIDSLHGKSAYEIAVENGYTGTEEQWTTQSEVTGTVNRYFDINSGSGQGAIRIQVEPNLDSDSTLTVKNEPLTENVTLNLPAENGTLATESYVQQAVQGAVPSVIVQNYSLIADVNPITIPEGITGQSFLFQIFEVIGNQEIFTHFMMYYDTVALGWFIDLTGAEAVNVKIKFLQ